ncbi:MAG: MBL fold metallo-hydrolase [Clostridiaceae bacterium]
MLIKKTVLGSYQENAYIIINEETREAIIIDPGDEGKSLIGYLKGLKVKLQYILLTRGHLDHVGAVDELREEFNIPAYISEADMKYIERRKVAFGQMKKTDFFLKEGDDLAFGNMPIKIFETPGHSKGSLSYLIDGVLYVGDVLFQGSIGRTDLPGGEFNELISSIKDKLMKLPGNTRVMPGHGPETTLAQEKSFNIYLR